MYSETNILYIDDSSPPNGSGWEGLPVSDKECMYDLAENISNKKADLLIINAHFHFFPNDNDFEKYKYLQDCAGIDLLKFLRLLGVQTHCILLSPLSVIQLLQLKPENLIIASKGVTVFPYAGNFENIETKKYIEKETDAYLSEIYFRSDFRLPEDERHNWANWWGIKQLSDVHKSIFPEEVESKENHNQGKVYPVKIDKKLKLLRNQQALKLYGHNVNIEKAVKKEILNAFDEKIDQKKITKRVLEQKIQKLTKQVEGTGKKNPTEEETFDFIKDRKKIIWDNKDRDDDWVETTQPIIEEQIEKAQNLLQEKTRLLNQKKKELVEVKRSLNILEKEKIQAHKSSGKSFNITEEERGFVSSFRHNKSEKPNILYVDDQADIGWSEIFQTMIYGKEEPLLFSSDIDCSATLNNIYNQIKNKIEELNPHVVLLDLRLKKESDNLQRVENLSGTYILKEIRKDFPGLPVMMTTASNKTWSYKTLIDYGADAYWMKEGIDIAASLSDGGRDEFSIKNYMEFLKKVQVLCGEKYQLLKTFGQFKNQINKIAESFWWEKGEWKHPLYPQTVDDGQRLKEGRQSVDKETVQNIISESFHLLKTYLKYSELKPEFYVKNERWFYPSLIIQQLGKIIEAIHGFDSLNDRDYTPNIKVIWNRNDETGGALYKQRGSASHYKFARDLDFESLKNFITDFIRYITHTPIYNNQNIRS